jgi:uncharacterized membrane protein
MSQLPPGGADYRTEQLVGNLLRTGVLASAAVVLVGAVLHLVQNGTTVPDYQTFQSEPPALRRIPDIVADALRFDGKGVIQLGILLLLATPVARVVLCVVVFALQRDRLYVLITLIVLAVLVYSLVGSRLHAGGKTDRREQEQRAPESLGPGAFLPGPLHGPPQHM